MFHGDPDDRRGGGLADGEPPPVVMIGAHAMRNGEEGRGRASFIITLAVFLVLVFLAVKIVPVRVDGYSFKEVLRKEARQAAVYRNDSAVLERIMDEAESMDIPLEKKNLTLRRSKVELVITASYEKPVDLKVGTYVYRFHCEQKAPIF
jgi:hypothetical protein